MGSGPLDEQTHIFIGGGNDDDELFLVGGWILMGCSRGP